MLLLIIAFFVSSCQHAKQITESLSLKSINDTVYTAVEKQPEPKSGFDKLYKDLGKNIKYPNADGNDNFGDHIIIKWVVEKDGGLSNFETLKGSPEISKQIIKLVSSMPKWTPGMLKNNAVRVRYTFSMIIDIGEQ